MGWLDPIYDEKKRKFRNRYVPLFGLLFGLIIVFIIGVMTDSPIIFTVSCIILVLSSITLVHDDWVFNSLVIPTAPTFMIVVMQDIHEGSFWAALFHLVILIFCIIPMLRKATSLSIMIISLSLFVGLVYAIKLWSGAPYYDELFGVPMDPQAQCILMLVLGVIVSVLISIKNWLLAKRSGEPIDCEDGICPL